MSSTNDFKKWVRKYLVENVRPGPAGITTTELIQGLTSLGTPQAIAQSVVGEMISLREITVDPSGGGGNCRLPQAGDTPPSIEPFPQLIRFRYSATLNGGGIFNGRVKAENSGDAVELAKRELVELHNAPTGKYMLRIAEGTNAEPDLVGPIEIEN